MSELNGLRVLLAEDDFLIASFIEDIMKRYGVAVTIVSQVTEILALDPAGFDVALLDRTLTDGDVAPGAEHLKAAGVPVIYQTGYEPDGEEDTDAVALLGKPVVEDELVAALLDAQKSSPRRQG